VSVITVRHAYEVLEGEGLIRALPAKGFFVAALSRRRMCRRAEERFAEALRPVLAAGREEGMSRQRLEEIFQRILDGLEPREREEVGGAS
jgi:DNA-binding transcriptional regulator YhcF (GntR family)